MAVRKTDPVPTLLIDVQLVRDFILLQSHREKHAVLRWNGSVFHRVPEKRRRRIGGHLLFVRKQIHHFLRRILAKQIAL